MVLQTRTIQFDTRGNEKQKLAAQMWGDQTTSDLIYGGTKYSGKSFFGASMIFGDAMIYPETSYFIARKYATDLERWTIPTISEVFKNYKIGPQYYKYRGGSNKHFDLYNGSKVYLIHAKDDSQDPYFERFGSMNMTRGWIEEGGEFTKNAYINLKISTGRKNNDVYNLPQKILITCNPKKNFLYRDFYLPFKKGKLSKNKAFIQALPQDNKAGNQAYIKMLFDTLEGARRQRLLFGNWEYDSDPAILVDYESILDVFTNTYLSGTGNEMYLTADLAGSGDDEAVFYVWRGMEVIYIEVHDRTKGSDTVKIMERLKNRFRIPNSQISFDAQGVGEGTTGFFPGAFEFKSSYASIGANNYKKLRDQVGFMLANAVNRGDIYIGAEISDSVHRKIIAELEVLKEDKLDNDLIKSILPKPKMKKELGWSPGHLDAMLQRMVFNIAMDRRTRRSYYS